MIEPGKVLALLMLILLVLIAIRMRVESQQEGHNHFVVMGGAFFAFTLIVRGVDAFLQSDTIRWSAVFGAVGAVTYLAATDPHIVDLLKKLKRKSWASLKPGK